MEKFDSLKEGTKEVAKAAHEKTNEFHEQYVSKVVPDCGKYGDAAKFVAEMAPGVSEYNAVREGDWQGFCIAAGIDVAAISAGILLKNGKSAAAVKQGGEAVARKGLKNALSEIAETGVRKTSSEAAESGVKNIVRETAEKSVSKASREITESGTKKLSKEVVETAAEGVIKETAEEGAQKGVEKIAKEVTENISGNVNQRLKQFGQKYFKELEEKTGETLSKAQRKLLERDIKKEQFYKLEKIETKMQREAFVKSRKTIRLAWEKNTGRMWPRYQKDICNKAGNVVRRKGAFYDMHHILELSYGGPNEWYNMLPVRWPDHQKSIHGLGSQASQIFP